MSAEPIIIELIGHIPSKKNNLRPRKGGGIMNDNKDVKLMIDLLAKQLPGKVRDLRLVSPEIHFYFFYERANWDRDNAVTTLLDILVKYGTLKDDNLANCNGLISIHPAQRSEQDSVKIILFPRQEELTSAGRYVDPRRMRKGAPLMPSMLRTTDTGEEEFPDFEMDSIWDD